MNQTHRPLATRFGNVYRGSVTQYQGESPLDEGTMRRYAPSIFAPSAHSSRSDRYAYIPTIEVLRGLQREGFRPFMVGQSTTRTEDRRDYTKHMIRLRRAGQITAREETNEIIVINSHGGESAYQMLAGAFRFVCMNGLVCGDIASDVRIKHSGKVQGEVIDAAFRIVDEFERVDASKDAMRALTLSRDEAHLFATAAAEVRFGSIEPEPGSEQRRPNAPFDVDELLRPRRAEDAGADLWRTFNRVQENVIRGGQPGRTALGRRMQTRPVQAIDRNVNVNRALWTLAEGMRRLKAGEPVAELVAA